MTVSGIRSGAQDLWRTVCQRAGQAKDYISPKIAEAKNTASSLFADSDSTEKTAQNVDDTTEDALPAAAADKTRKDIKAALGKVAFLAKVGASCTKKNGAIGLGLAAAAAAAAAGFQAIKKMNNNETSKVWAASSGALATASALIHTGINLANKLNPFAAAFSGAMNGASSSYDINKADNGCKSDNTKNIEAAASGLLTAGASVKAASLAAAAAGAGPAVMAGIVIGTPIVAAACASRTVKLVSDYFGPK